MTAREKFTAQVTLPSDTEVCVTRGFHAPRALVWRAHTEPELARRWLGFPDWTMPVCEMDVRPGGKYRWRWRSGDGSQEFGFFGTFTEVEEPSVLSHEEHFDPGTFGGAMQNGSPAMIRTTFAEKNGVTTLVSVMDYGSREARDAALSTGMTDGMEVSYQRLDAIADDEGGR